MDIIKIEIEEQEWVNFPAEKRERIKELLAEQYGYDLSLLDDMVDQVAVERKELEQDEIFRQFYGDEEE